MLTFSTEFPIASDQTVGALIKLALEWIAGSPHTTLPESMLQWQGTTDGVTFGDSDERVEVLCTSSEAFQVGGIRYSRVEGDELEWVTTVVGFKDHDAFWVGIRVSCDALSAGRRIPQPKKPQIVRLLLERFPSGKDGDLEVTNQPVRLTSNQIDYAARCLNSEAGNHLPIVYVSAPFHTDIDLEDWSRKLAGLAHVLVEPNRAFSIRLAQDVQWRNAYGGTVGLFWPGGQGRKLYSGQTSHELLADINRDVRLGLAARRVLTKCTWAFLSETVARSRYEALKADKSASVEAYVATFDEQLSGLSQQLDAGNREIARLQSVIRGLEVQAMSASGSLLARGSEIDFFSGEVVDVILDAIQASRNNVVQESRRQHILDAVIKANQKAGGAEEIYEQIKVVLKDYRTLDSNCRTVLESTGFVITDEGKHYKVIYQNDDRYVFSLSKTSSDHRAGMNIASDIRKKVF